jgi:hypothetical protein
MPESTNKFDWNCCPVKLAGLRYICRLRAGYRLPAGKQVGILTESQTKVNKKNGQKSTFLGRPFPQMIL